LHNCVINAFFEQRLANLIVRGGVLEPRRNNSSAFEVDAEIESLPPGGLPDDRRSQTREHEQHGYANEKTPVTQPVNIYIVKDLKHD
jgi:hypothetical protein